MQGKQKIGPQQDPIATSTSGFKRAQPPHTKTESIKLPLKAWSYGTKVLEMDHTSDSPYLVYTPQNMQLQVSYHRLSFSPTFQLDSNVDKMTVRIKLLSFVALPILITTVRLLKTINMI